MFSDITSENLTIPPKSNLVMPKVQSWIKD